MNMLPFVRTGGRSCWHATFPLAATPVERVGKSTTLILWPNNSGSFKAAQCPCSLPFLFLVEDDSLALRRRNAETLRMSSRSGARSFASDQLFLNPSVLTLSVTGGRRIPKTSSGNRSTISSPKCSAIVPRKRLPFPLRRKFKVFGYPYSILSNVFTRPSLKS